MYDNLLPVAEWAAVRVTVMETSGEEDQVLACLGNIGRWQWRNILITGLFCAPSVWHIMIITFMNAEVVISPSLQ